MFNRIESTIVRVLQEQLKTVPKENIHSKNPGAGAKLPAVSVSNVDFEIGEVGVGRSIGGEDATQLDRFSGDGKKNEFVLSEKPVRPILAVEHPPGKKLGEAGYSVDYRKGAVTFASPPEKGEDNVYVRYLKPFETKGLRFKLRYHVNVMAKDEDQRDEVAVEVMETLLREEEALNREGVFLKPVKGFNAQLNDESNKGPYGKTIEYLIETDLIVEVPYSRMEEIEVKKV